MCCTPLDPYISGVETRHGGQGGHLERVSGANERSSLAECKGSNSRKAMTGRWQHDDKEGDICKRENGNIE